MKKLLILVLCICVLGVATFFVGGKMSRTPEMPFEPEESNQTKSLDVPETESSSPTNRTIETIVSTADLAVVYTDFKSLIADAEMIVVGKVNRVESIFNEQSQINSIVDIDLASVLKGDVVEKTMSFYVTGGVVSTKAFYEENAEILKDKLTPEVFEKEMSNATLTDMIDSVFMGVKNIGVGDELLLFLTYDEDIGYYRVTGSPYNGKFYFDESSDSVFKIIDDEKSMFSTLSGITELAETTPDNSAKIREEWMNRAPIEKEGEIVERDPAFDKYKE